jgi:hypothetical protein
MIFAALPLGVFSFEICQFGFNVDETITIHNNNHNLFRASNRAGVYC